MPRGFAAGFLAELAKNLVRPYQTVEAYYDSGVRRFWDGAVDRQLHDANTYEGGMMLEITPLQLRSSGGAARCDITVHALATADLAQALSEDFYGRRCRIGRGFFAADGTVAAHDWIVDGLMMGVVVRHEVDESVTWKTTVEIGTARGREAVGRRRTNGDQKARAKFLLNDDNYVDTGFRHVKNIRKPIPWPAAGYVPPDMKR